MFVELIDLWRVFISGDYRELGESDEGASSIMKSHTLAHKGDRRYQRPKQQQPPPPPPMEL